MVNVSKLVAWLYNLFFNADKKREKLKQKGHYLIYQNKADNDYSDEEKEKINMLQEKVEEYKILIQKINGKYQEYLHERLLSRKQAGGTDE